MQDNTEQLLHFDLCSSTPTNTHLQSRITCNLPYINQHLQLVELSIWWARQEAWLVAELRHCTCEQSSRYNRGNRDVPSLGPRSQSAEWTLQEGVNIAPLPPRAGWRGRLDVGAELHSRHDLVRLEETSGFCHFCPNCNEILFPSF